MRNPLTGSDDIELCVVFIAYMIPGIIGYARGINKPGQLAMINLLFGWTAFVWAGCLVLALHSKGGVATAAGGYADWSALAPAATPSNRIDGVRVRREPQLWPARYDN